MVTRLPLTAGIIALATLILLLIPAQAQALDENNCLLCHSSPELTKVNGDGHPVSLFVPEENLNTSAHRFIDCTTCHTPDPHATDTPLTKSSLAERCGGCHEYQYALHKESVHGEQLALGNPDVATCVDCHSPAGNPHSVIRVLEYNAPAYRKNAAETCAKCHGDEDLMGRYGLLEKVYESYMRSFHGKAIQLGSYELSQLDKATCPNCHGTHDIARADDPDSPVAGVANLAITCEQCHEGAGIEFASGFLGHKEVSPQTSAVLYYTERFFITLTTTVLTFAVLVSGSAVFRWGLKRWKE